MAVRRPDPRPAPHDRRDRQHPRRSRRPGRSRRAERCTHPRHGPPAKPDTPPPALPGGAVPAGPSGAPTRGMAHVLPTGRNFYAVDPKAVPSRLAWDVGQKLADEVIARHVRETGTPPTTV